MPDLSIKVRGITFDVEFAFKCNEIEDLKVFTEDSTTDIYEVLDEVVIEDIYAAIEDTLADLEKGGE